MTYLERFGTSLEYQKYEAMQHIHRIEKDGYKFYCKRYHAYIDLLSYPEIDMTTEEKEARLAAIKNIEYLRRVATGEERATIYLLQWRRIKNTEWPEWREKWKYLEGQSD